MTLDAQNFGFTASSPVVLGKNIVLAFTIEGVVASDLSAAEWSLFDFQPIGGGTAPTAVITKTVGSGIALTDDGTDLTVTVSIDDSDQVDMAPGDYWHRLDYTKTSGDEVQAARGLARLSPTA